MGGGTVMGFMKISMYHTVVNLKTIRSKGKGYRKQQILTLKGHSNTIRNLMVFLNMNLVLMKANLLITLLMVKGS